MLDNYKIYYWYYENDYKEKKVPLGSFLLSEINNVRILNDGEVGGRKNLMLIKVSSWLKKEIPRGPRAYYFSVKTREELLTWVITINFIQINATYNQFTRQFGSISLPLKHELKKINKTTTKLKLNLNTANFLRVNNTIYDTITRKGSSKSFFKNQTVLSNFVRKSLFTYLLNSSEIHEESDNIARVKAMLKDILPSVFILFFANIQDIVFNIHMNKIEMVISIPAHVRDFYYEDKSGLSISSLPDKSDSDIIVSIKEQNTNRHISLDSNLSLKEIKSPQKLLEKNINIDNNNLLGSPGNFEPVNNTNDINFKNELLLQENVLDLSFNDKIKIEQQSDEVIQQEDPIDSDKDKNISKNLFNNKNKLLQKQFSFEKNSRCDPLLLAQTELTEEEKNEIIEKTNSEDNIGRSDRISLIPKYSEPKYDYLKYTKSNYSVYTSSLFKKLN